MKRHQLAAGESRTEVGEDALAPRTYRTTDRDGCDAVLVIDSLLNGRAAGGVRMSPDVTDAEVAALARVMTLKFGFANGYYGGAKSGIRFPDSRPDHRRKAALRAFGRAFRDLIGTGVYRPAEDIGTSPTDVTVILDAGGYSRAAPDVTSSGAYTAMSAVAAAEAVCRAQQIPLRRASFAVEGFGKVGSQVARLLCEKGARLLAISTRAGAVFDPGGLDLPWLLDLGNRHGDECVRHYVDGRSLTLDRMLRLETDLLILAGKSAAIDGGTCGAVKARIVIPAGNLALTPDAETGLARAGRLIVPDFVANCGGVLGLTWHGMGLSDEQIRRLIDQELGRKLDHLLRCAGSGSVRTVAETVAAQNIRRMQAEVAPLNGDRLARLADRLRAEPSRWIMTQILRRLARRRGGSSATVLAYAKAIFWADRTLYRRLVAGGTAR